jgi:periplasmic protein TonB
MTTYAAGPSRQSAVVTTVLGIHVGLFLVLASGLGRDVWHVIKPDPAPVRIIPKEPPKPVLIAPGPRAPDELQVPRVPEPDIPIPEFEKPVAAPTAEMQSSATTGHDAAGSGPGGTYQAPALRTRDVRLAALIDSCYPAASRRRGEEGRVLVDLTIAASGRPGAWRVAESSGFAGLDVAAGCVVGKLTFIPGRRDGRAVDADARLPIVFRLN